MLKKLIFLSTVIALFLSTTAGIQAEPKEALDFTDVTDNHSWATEAIDALSSEGILDGIDETHFAPDETVTKEQFAKMLTLALSAEPDAEAAQTYTDVPMDRWSFPYIEAVKDFFPLDVLVPVNQFAPETPFSRQEVAATIINGMGLSADANVFNKDLLGASFTDSNMVRPSITTQVTVAVERGILRGADGLIRPEAPVTRAEAAVFIHRMMLIRQGKGELYFMTSTPIVAESQVSLERAKEWATERGAHQRFIDIADIYWKYGEITGIRPEVLYAQAAKETGYGKYGGRVLPEQNNWAGIKTATANGDATYDHESFETPEDGVRAHFNHMSAYLGLEPVGEPHGRYHTASRTAWAGTVKTVEELGNKWAPEHTYGYSLVTKYIMPMMGE
ncbi:MAG: S-layer homology domain-containing protein [Clostridia bacterium]|nr:S-layer homology domain-containing protein [Clostridia bacterium]